MNVPLHIDYPVCLRLAGKKVVVVGGGTVATARVVGLVNSGAHVTVIAPKVTDEISVRAARGELIVHLRQWRPTDFVAASLAVVAIDDPVQSTRIANAAREKRILVTVADQPELCDFTMPSVGRRGPVTIAVSTAGRAPALARSLRIRFEQQVLESDLALIPVVDRLRSRLPAGKTRMRFIRAVVDVAQRASALARWRVQPHPAPLGAKP